ncbi:single-stranded DNA-binding protein [Patescibacteria group bacterium]|nr:single-stranded DNA-binding protein [Patescibacteria group bacterium]MBU1124198.1 single-stranded DNA-binding protein [Patescibacteria group bacterium]MBU1910893.1 single-stranded DNA-binding protein [Patescibacteria group bacterium]
MKSVNKVTLLGNITRDPELKNTTNGQSVCTFGIATNRVWKDSTGDKQSLPEYHNLVAWGGLAEFCSQNVKKGKPLYIEGYLKTRSWDSPEGTKIFRTEVVVENIVLLGPKGEMDSPVIEERQVPEAETVVAGGFGEPAEEVA